MTLLAAARWCATAVACSLLCFEASASECDNEPLTIATLSLEDIGTSISAAYIVRISSNRSELTDPPAPFQPHDLQVRVMREIYRQPEEPRTPHIRGFVSEPEVVRFTSWLTKAAYDHADPQFSEHASYGNTLPWAARDDGECTLFPILYENVDYLFIKNSSGVLTVKSFEPVVSHYDMWLEQVSEILTAE